MKDSEQGDRLKRLWAPWRLAYAATAKSHTATDHCFICAAVASSNDRETLLVHRGEHSIVLLNKFPYNSGHLLIAPRAHKADLGDLTHHEILATQASLTDMIEKLRGLMKPEGFNVGLNLGSAAGAGLPSHLHWHVVPRWNGDTNFMPIFTDAKVMVQSLDALFDLLVEARG